MARRGYARDQFVGLAVAIGVPCAGRVKREDVWASHTIAICRCFWSITNAITVRISVARFCTEGFAKFSDVGYAVAVHVVVHEVTNTVAVHVIGDAGGVERFALAGHLGRVEVAIVVVVIVRRQTAWAVWVDVRVSIAVGIDRQGRVKR